MKYIMQIQPGHDKTLQWFQIMMKGKAFTSLLKDLGFGFKWNPRGKQWQNKSQIVRSLLSSCHVMDGWVGGGVGWAE